MLPDSWLELTYYPYTIKFIYSVVSGRGGGGQLGADQYLKSWARIKGKEIEAIKPLIYILLFVKMGKFQLHYFVGFLFLQVIFFYLKAV